MATVSATIPIDDYAESMFRFERLHPRWLGLCEGYLRLVLGATIEGAVFLDYAFGRGNWSLAALKAGAKRVIAVDAAEGNVRRLSDYCRANGIGGIEIIHGNVLDAPLKASADILWIYGILSSVEEPDRMLAGLATARRDDCAVAVLYGYDHGSLRQVIVDAARQDCRYSDERAFAADSFLFVPRARLRARDDLTAPAVLWYSAAKFYALAQRNGLVLRRNLTDFRGWLDTNALREFAPHVALYGFAGKPANPSNDAVGEGAEDAQVLAEMADAVRKEAIPEQRRKIAIGLFNTHFAALTGSEPAMSATIEDFLFLMHAALRLEVPATALPPAARAYYEAALAATTDTPRGLAPALAARSPLAAFLNANTVRF
jgi:hypothetical protein